MKNPEYIIRNQSGKIITLELNDPKKLNALSDEMLEALKRNLLELSEDDSCHVIIIKGAGKAFCAGHDLKQIRATREESNDNGRMAFANLFERCTEVMLQIRNQPQPVIAQVHGIATAAGCQLVATCDLAIAEKETKFGVNGVNIGLFCSTPMVALSRNIGRKNAFEMLTTGNFIDAAKAKELGLINDFVPSEKLEQRTLSLADQIAGKLGSVVKIGKRAFYDQIEMPLEQAYAYAGGVMVENLQYKDTIEGIEAFTEKREPNWRE